MTRKIRTLTEARRAYPRGTMADFRDRDMFPGCVLKVWRHEIGHDGYPRLSGYLFRETVSYDADGGEILHRSPVWSRAQMAQMWVSDVRPEEVR